MFGLLSQNPKYYLNDFEQNQEFGFDAGRLSFGGGGSGVINNVPSTIAVTNAKPAFDFDVSQINTTAAKGKGSVADIKSAYELFSTGQTQGRAYGYAQDIQRRFTPGLIQTYGASDIRIAAANYLDSVGLPRLAQIVTPTPTPTPTTNPVPDFIDQFFPLPVDPRTTSTTTEKPDNPFEILADIIPKLFGNAVYNPPLQSQASGFTGIDQGTPLAEVTGSGNIGTYVVLGVIGVIAYFLYKRFA